MQRQIDNNQRSAVNAAEQNSHTPRNHSLASGLHQTALKNPAAVRVAVNRVYGDLTTTDGNNDEVAFFPPVTGG